MRTNRNINPHHNGKNRRTGNRKGGRSTTKKGPAKGNSERAESIRTKWVAAKLEERKKKEEARSVGPCCPSDAAKMATNHRLLASLQSTVCDRVWNELLGRWEGIVPRSFVRKNAVHMVHFREFARKNGYRC